MKGLPPILDRVRMKLKPEDLPPVVIHIPNPDAISAPEEIISKHEIDGNIPILNLSHWWLEVTAERAKVGMLIRASQDGETTVKSFEAHGRWLDTFSFQPFGPSDDFKRWNGISHRTMAARLLLTGELIRIMNYLWLVENSPADVPVLTGVRQAPCAFQRVGDTLRYDRLESLRTTSGQQRGYVPPEEPSGIRKRDHAVRGHWRTYRTGVRVWVREHRRGDAELGSVTRVLS